MKPIEKARISVMLRHPWWSHLVMNLKYEVAPSIQSAMTNGEIVRYNETWFNGLEEEQQISLLVHEALHCAFLHHLRRGDRDPALWNIAADYSVNGIMVDSGLGLPGDGLHDPRFRGMAAEQIFDLIKDSQKGKSPPVWGDVEDGNSSEKSNSESGWKDALAAAVEHLQKSGSCPDYMQKSLENALCDPIDWKELLCAYVYQVIGQDNHSWRRLSRRSVVLDISLPGRISDRQQPIGIIIDTSGSIDEKMLSEAMQNVCELASSLDIDHLVIFEADTVVRNVTELSVGDSFEAKHLSGGGGTSFVEPLKQMDLQNVAVTIYITDTEGDFPSHEPSTPVIWLTKEKNASVPFGHLVVVN